MTHDNKLITAIHHLNKVVNIIYHYGHIVYQAIRSCFGSGWWINDAPWSNDEGWNNGR